MEGLGKFNIIKHYYLVVKSGVLAVCGRYWQ